MSLYFRYKTLDIVELKEMPLTGHERVQPRQSMLTQAETKTNESFQISDPFFVRVGKDDYNWTMLIEPPPGINQLISRSYAVFNVSGEEAYPSFEGKAKVKVAFETGQHMILGKNVITNTIKTFGLWRFLNYQPAEMFLTKDDEGRWVEVVKLIHWNGIIFPWPEKGGVLIIPDNSQLSFLQKLKLWVFGIGKWIPPEDIFKHPFLKGQSIVPAIVERFDADSFKFDNGFWGPAPFYHMGDVVVSDLSEDSNEQPFTTYFNFPNEPEKSKLYGYFSFEPYYEPAKGLNASMLYPGDGIGPIYVYKHYMHGENYTGVGAVAQKIQDSRKAYTWQIVRAVENRPYIKIIDGKATFFWLSTVVTLNKDNPERFGTGGKPEIAIMNADNDKVYWVNPENPKHWVDQIINNKKEDSGH
ncbi:MAG: hypothetical protein WAV31_00345 [Candidatus Moraniibacteriota bacterium]